MSPGPALTTLFLCPDRRLQDGSRYMATLRQRRREREPEHMDDPALLSQEHLTALKGLSRLNLAAGTARLFWHHLRPIVSSRPAGPWRLLDVASGAGDVAVGLWRLASNEGFDLQIAGCDIGDRAIRVARARADAAHADVRFFSQDAERDEFGGGYELVISSLFLHHLSENESLALLRRLTSVTRRLLLVCDLRRCALGLATAFIATRVLTASAVVRADGVRSVRAAYTIPEVRTLAARAGLARARVVRRWPSRWLLAWSRQ
jgi:SAM-dependent methyltransferase